MEEVGLDLNMLTIIYKTCVCVCVCVCVCACVRSSTVNNYDNVGMVS